MRIINVEIRDEYAKGNGAVVGAAGSHDDVALRLKFCRGWEGLSKSIVWQDSYAETSTITILTTALLAEGESDTYIVPVPAEAKRYEGEMSMTIKGVTVDVEVESAATLTTTAHFKVLPSAWDDDAAESEDITPSLYEQLQAEFEAIKGDIILAGKAADAKEAAEQSAQEAAGAADEAEGHATAAAEYAAVASAEKSAAEGFADAARASAAAAKGSEDTIARYADDAKAGADSAAEYAAAASAAVGKTSYIGANGNWMQWSVQTGNFVDTGVKAQGPAGDPGYTPQKNIDYFDGEKGDPFTYADFTEEQLAELKGAPGYTPQKNIDYFDGAPGKDGVSVSSVVQTTTSTESGGVNVVTVTLSDGNSSTFRVRNGSGGGIAEETDPTVPAYVKSITEADIAKWNEGGSGDSNVFIAEYDVTTFEEISAALQAGKAVFCSDGAEVYTCLDDDTVGIYQFSGVRASQEEEDFYVDAVVITVYTSEDGTTSWDIARTSLLQEGEFVSEVDVSNMYYGTYTPAGGDKPM